MIQLSDPDEVFYSLTAKEMNQRNEWLTPYIFDHPQFEKPILTYWLLKVSFLTFGDTPFAARFFPAVFATFGVFGVYLLGLLGFMNEKRSFLAALVLGTSAFYIGMAKTTFTDMIFSVFILYSLLFFFSAYVNNTSKRWGMLGFYIFAALATLTKGPLGLLIPELTVVIFLLYCRRISFLNSIWMYFGFLAYLVLTLPWYVYEISLYGNQFVHEFFYNDHWRRFIEAEHKGADSWYFYLITMVGGLFPWSLFLVASFYDIYKRIKFSLKPFEYFLLSWIIVVFIIFQSAHSKLASYILPMFPALALLTANFIDEAIEHMQYVIIKRLSYIILAFIAFLGIASLLAYKFYQMYIPTMSPIYFLSAGLLTIGGISLTLFFKERVREGVVLLGFCLMPFFLTVLMMTSYIEPHISMCEATTYLPWKALNHSSILVSKPYARGVRYYTGQNVAVMDINGENYFSPHPIPILNTKEKILEFVENQNPTFAILRKSQFLDLNEYFSKELHIDILKVVGPNYVLKLEKLKSS